MTIAEIENLCKSLAKKHNYNFKIPVSLNKRLKKTLGRVLYKKNGINYEPYKIEFSQYFLDKINTNENLEEKYKLQKIMIDVIKHEMAHYFVFMDTKKVHHHDSFFKEWAKKLNISTKANIKINTIENSEISKYKYFVICSKCKKIIYKYKRACKVTKHPSHYVSKCCKSKIEIKKLK